MPDTWWMSCKCYLSLILFRDIMSSAVLGRYKKHTLTENLKVGKIGGGGGG